MALTKTLLSTNEDVKKAFKIECAKNGTDMSTITEILWLKYIGMSVDRRKQRADEKREKIKNRIKDEG